MNTTRKIHIILYQLSIAITVQFRVCRVFFKFTVLSLPSSRSWNYFCGSFFLRFNAFNTHKIILIAVLIVWQATKFFITFVCFFTRSCASATHFMVKTGLSSAVSFSSRHDSRLASMELIIWENFLLPGRTKSKTVSSLLSAK